jgi:hypothetical protein
LSVHRRYRAFVVSLIAHTVAIGIVTMPSRPAPKKAGTGSRRDQTPADASTRIIRPDRERQPRADPEASKLANGTRLTVSRTWRKNSERLLKK